MANELVKEETVRETELTTADLITAGDSKTYRDDSELAPRDRQIENGTTRNAAAVKDAGDAEQAPLFSADEAKDLRTRWDGVQVGFVDEPRHAVEQADSLVATAMKRLAEMFAEERANLEGQWDRGDSVSTEDLRLALRRYHSFFGRLLSI